MMGVPKCGKTVFGVCLIVCVALIWTFSSYLVKTIQLQFRGPFFLTYFANSLFALYLPLLLIKRKFCYSSSGNTLTAYDPIGDDEGAPTKTEGTALFRIDSPTWSHVFASMKNTKTFRNSLIVCPLWFLANFLYNASLLYTSVSSSTVLSATSCVFTALIALRMGSEKFHWFNVLAVLMTVGGTGMVVFGDSSTKTACTISEIPGKNATGGDGTENSGVSIFLGDILALGGAVFYAIYTVAIQVKVGEANFDELALFLGYLGAIGCISLFPIVLVLNATGVESLSELPFDALLMMGFKGLFDNVFSDLLWARAVLLTSPTVSTIGINLTIPFSIFIDWTCGKVPSFVNLFGALLLMFGFVLVSKRSMADSERNRDATVIVDAP